MEETTKSAKQRDWLSCISTVAEVDRSPRLQSDLDSAYLDAKEHIIRCLQDRSRLLDTTPPYIACYPDAGRDVTYGGIRHLVTQERNLIARGADMYLDICVNHHWINQLHIIASDSGAFMAIRFIEFIDHYGTTLQFDLQRLESAWSLFLNTHEFSDKRTNKNALLPIIRSLTLIHPSLPTPSGIVRVLGRWMLPPTYGLRSFKHLDIYDSIALLIVHLEDAYDTEEMDTTPTGSLTLRDSPIIPHELLEKAVLGLSRSKHSVRDLDSVPANPVSRPRRKAVVRQPRPISVSDSTT